MSEYNHIPKGPCTKSWTFHSPFNSNGEEVILGVDEAGRGPVLGSMVYAVAYVTKSNQSKLADLGFADSKTLSPEERDSLFEKVYNSDFIGWGCTALSPQDISESMLRRAKYNLNAMAHDTTIELIKSVLAKGIHLTQVFVDTVGPPEKYQDKLSSIFKGIEFTVTKKADSLFPIVSCASIVAKVTRDETIKYWEYIEQINVSGEFGSGYPSDPNTVRWLQQNMDPIFGFPRIVRFSWSTCSNLLEEKGVKMEWECDRDDEVTEKWFKAKKGPTRDVLYTSMGLTHINTF